MHAHYGHAVILPRYGEGPSPTHPPCMRRTELVRPYWRAAICFLLLLQRAVAPPLQSLHAQQPAYMHTHT